MKVRIPSIFLCSFFCVTSILNAESHTPTGSAKSIVEATGVRGGIVVQLGIGDGTLTSALRINDSYQVHGIDRDPEKVATVRKSLSSKGNYGAVSVDRISGNALPYIDNFVNLFVTKELGDIPMKEVIRVLAPRGVAYIHDGKEWKITTKSVPDNIDEWTHYLHDASGNAVAHDDAVGPPRHLQWLGSPRWSRHHDRMASMSALVSTNGRIFYIMDEGSRISIQMPPKWRLIARDAFNGTILWKRDISSWHDHLWPLKSGPTQLARRLVAVGDQVYVTLGLDEPLSILDAATGETLRTVKAGKSTEEIVFSDGLLFLLVNDGKSELSSYSAGFNVGDQRRVFNEFVWNESPRKLVAVEPGTGRILWEETSKVAPLTVSTSQDSLFYHDGEKVVSRDRYTGKENWSSTKIARRAKIPFNFGPRLVVNKGVVLFAGGDRKMRGLDADSGKELWAAAHDQSGYQSPEDLLVSGGLVWSAPTTSGRMSGKMTGRDPKTGEVKVEFDPNVETYWFHHRCYIAKATDKYLMTSRTGIEFVNPAEKNWDIHHWVRGGCLYGIMPCNGMVYAPPHNCACYPEAKLYGMNALAPTSVSRVLPKKLSDDGRLEFGPAYNEIDDGPTGGKQDWPTYRHDVGRSGLASTSLSPKLQQDWTTQLSGRLSAVTVADARLFVSEIDKHTVHALNASTGRIQWSYMTGGRVDSPPTVVRNRVVFGSADGWVYCLRAYDGELAWRFRAAPIDRRLAAFEQIESVWPVHGSILVEDGVCSFVAGRSNYLDGGIRLIRLNLLTGDKLVESEVTDKDPESGKNLQARLQTLQMSTGLPDVLSSDGESMYMRSQRFDRDGNRIGLGPHSGDAAKQGAVQAGPEAHLFAPMGFLDDTWFHRSYWVYGRSFAGGHNGYYQAGKYAPSGRILCFDKDNVYGFGRKPQYLKWTTTIEHQLFSTPKAAPKEALEKVDPASKLAKGGKSPMVQFANKPSLDPTKKAIVVEAWAKAQKPNGVIIARGGPAEGFALWIQKGRPRFTIRAAGKIYEVAAKKTIAKRWAHLVGVLGSDKKLKLFVDGEIVANGEAKALIQSDPLQKTEIGADDGGGVGSYKSPYTFSGLIDEVRVMFGDITNDEIEARYFNPLKKLPASTKLAMEVLFKDGKAIDTSGNENHGTIVAAQPTEGKVGMGMSFSAKGGNSRSSGSFVKHHWNSDIPLLARAMLVSSNNTQPDDKIIFVAGPPDLIDEEQTFQKIIDRDKTVQAKLAEQNAALSGSMGGRLLSVSAKTGETIAEHKLPSPPVWDGFAAANGKLYMATTDGKIVCLGAKR